MSSEPEQGAVDPIWLATVESRKALDTAMQRLGGEAPTDVYDEKGYTIWLEATAAAITKPIASAHADRIKELERALERIVSWSHNR